MSNLYEYTRNQLITKSKSADTLKDGSTRYKNRVKSRVASSNRQYNEIDMNKLFKENILDVNIHVQGETDDYVVTISFGGFLDTLRHEIERTDIIDLRTITRAIIISFNKGDVYLKCTCPDWKYRFAYFATKDDIIIGDEENRPSDITNPDNTKGPACKHVLMVLANTSWIIKVASVINNYITYMSKHKEKLYQTIIYPAIYGKKYEEPIQDDLFDEEDLSSDKEDIDKSNQYAREKNQFKQ